MSAPDRPPARPRPDETPSGARPLQERLDADATATRPADEAPTEVSPVAAAPVTTPVSGTTTPAVETTPAAPLAPGGGSGAGTDPPSPADTSGERPENREGAPHPADEAEARVAYIREEARATDVRRAEEERAEAEALLEARRREEAEARERAEAAAAEAARAPGESAGGGDEARTGAALGGASLTSPGVGTRTEPRTAAVATRPRSSSVSAPPAQAPSGPAGERPELLLGAAFAGAFLLARLLRRILD